MEKERSNEWRYELRLIKAEADGVGPSILLSAPNHNGKGKGAEYLFNVPEGFSRLVLEHKIRPSSRLASIFLTSLRPNCAGGLGGLLLKLADDGHGQLQLVGPDCTSAFLHSLRHIIYWRHPKVFVCDCHLCRPLPVYDDDFVTVCPIQSNGKLLTCPWFEHGKNGCKENADLIVKNRSECKFFDDITCSDSYDEVDSSTSNRSESSDVVENDIYNMMSKILYKGSEIYEEESIQVKEECQVRRVGTTFSQSRNSFNGKRKKGGSEHLPTSTMEDLFEDKKKCTSLGSTMEHFNGKGWKGDRSTKNTVMESFLSSSKRQRSLMSGLNESSLLDADAGNEIVYEDLQCSTCPSIKSLNSCSKRSIKLVPEMTKHMDKEVLDSGMRESEPINDVHENKCMHDIRKINDLRQSGLSTMQQHEQLVNDNASKVKFKDEVMTVISNSRGQDSQCPWRVNNSMETDLPPLPDGAVPLYIKSPVKGVIVISEESVKQNKLAGHIVKDDQSSSKPRELIGFICYMKKLRSAFLVVDCYTPELADELYQNSTLSSCYNNENDQSRCLHAISAVIHFTPPSVLRSEKYMTWMRHLGDDTVHIVMQGESAEYGFLYSFSTLAKMNMVNNQIFPLPFNVSQTNQQMDIERLENFQFIRQVKIGRLLMCVAFQGSHGNKVQVVVDDSMCRKNTNVDIIQKSFAQRRPDIADITKKLAEHIQVSSQDESVEVSANKMAALALREKLFLQRKTAVKESAAEGVSLASSKTFSNNLNSLGAERNYSSLSDGRAKPSLFKLLFLGTGCAEPMKHRGSSGILLEVKERASMLLDAGEGVAGQILRAFGKNKMRKVVEQLQCIWISHKHADHVLGIISIIAARSNDGPDLIVVGSTAVHQWLQEVNHIYGSLGYSFPSFTFVNCQDLMAHHPGGNWFKRLECDDQISRMLENLQLYGMRCVWVDHCFQACGLVLQSLSGWSIVYSGDTRPCKSLIEAGKGCTLLIHEATFEDNFESHARAKRHCTISEALEVGQQMNAKHVILTHFSQRSPKIMGIDIPNNQSASFAYDGMVVCSFHLSALTGLMQCLVTFFNEYDGIDHHDGTDGGQNSNANLANQTKQFPGASDKKRSNTLKVGVASICNRSRSNAAHTTMAIPSTQLQSSEQCRIPKHIRWNDSESEDD